MAKKKSLRPAPRVKATRTLETAYPFPLKADRDYRLTFRNGQSAIYHGGALTSNPQVPVAEIVQVVEENTGEVIFAVPREKQAEEKPGFYRTE